MPRVIKYFKQQSDEDPSPDDDKVVALGVPDDIEDDSEDQELIAAKAYMKAVREQSRTLPFAVVADTGPVSPQVALASQGSTEGSAEVGDVGEDLRVAIVEYFVSLRMLLKKEGVERREKVIDFCEDCADSLASADPVSISNAVEDLSELLDDLSPDQVSEWLFGLLVHLEEPLLEDTAAALQKLRRYCSSKPSDHRLQVCSVIVRFYFNQR